MVVIMWNIWFRRNQLRVSNKDHPISQVIPTSQQALLNYQQSSNLQRTQRVNPPPNRVAWTPPPDGCVKINFDGVTFNDINKAGLGVVIWDSFGQVLASLSEQIQLPFSSDLVEAMATARALSFVAELGFSRFILEGDSELIIKSNEDSLAPFGHILEVAKSTTDVNRVSFTHVRRLGNAVAHNLAKHARHVAGLQVWMEDVPPTFFLYCYQTMFDLV